MTDHHVGRLADFPDGDMRILDLSGRSIGVYRRGDDLYGILNVCPHRAAPVCRGEIGGTMLPSRPGELEYGMDGLVLRCPWHGWEFDVRSGECLFDVDSRRLKTFAVRVSGDDVYCDVEMR
ncbi:MAG: hypothetical protein QOJ12_2702 [Thermoleophilales bacterium]|nr:hypothetical protein [Thermoleophilales bacterium]